ncbi:hypothetical protein ABKV19_000333, partial [Rosa sericea]
KFPLGAARKRYKPRHMRAERGNELHNGKLIVQNWGFRSCMSSDTVIDFPGFTLCA